MKTTFNPKIHFKSKGGTGYQMKKNKIKKSISVKKGTPTPDGMEIAKVFGWTIEHKENGRNNSIKQHRSK